MSAKDHHPRPQQRSPESEVSRRLWVPDNPDGSGWADVDWVSAVRGSRYHYRHAPPRAEALAALPPFYRVVTRLESATLEPHENSYFVPRDRLADFLAELALAGGAEIVWHIAGCTDPPPESRVARGERGRDGEGGTSSPPLRPSPSPPSARR